MPYALFGLITMLLWIFCIVDAITRDDAYILYLPKVVWILIIIFIPTLGSIVWLVPRIRTPGQGRRTGSVRRRSLPTAMP